MAEPQPKRARLDDSKYVASANQAMTVRLLDPVAEPQLVEACSFHPEFTHQLYGDDEEIKGYEDLSISLSFSQRTFQALVETKHTSRQRVADNILKPLQETFSAGFSQSRAEFQKALASTPATDPSTYGQVLSTSQLAAGGQLTVHHTNLSQAHPLVKQLHARLEPLLTFFIDGFSAIDPEDPRWDLLLAVETNQQRSTVVGFCTVYHFFGWPDRTRLRVSQVFVLPPHQRKGVGRQLLESVYALADKANAKDVTFEDPTDSLQALRERVDLARAHARAPLLVAAAEQAASQAGGVQPLGLSAARGANGANGANGATSAPRHPLELPADLVMRSQCELRIPKGQVRRLWEVLLYEQQRMRAASNAASLLSLVKRRLASGVASAKGDATNKRVFDLAESGFIMMKCHGQLAEAGAAPMLEDENGNPAEREAALAEAVQARWAQLASIVGTTA